jgi:hypothetical protein
MIGEFLLFKASTFKKVKLTLAFQRVNIVQENAAKQTAASTR